jgi:hypothetical protein
MNKSLATLPTPIESKSAGGIWGTSAYTCTVTDSTGTRSISWNPTTMVFTMTGNPTIWIDGNANQTNALNVIYTGIGTIYFSGTVAIVGAAHVCPSSTWDAATSTCNSAGHTWNSNNDMIVLVAYNMGNTTWTSTANDSWTTSNGSACDCAAYANGGIVNTGSAGIMGPMIGDMLTISNSASYYQSLGSNGLPSGGPVSNVYSTSTAIVTSTITVPIVTVSPVSSTVQVTDPIDYTVTNPVWGQWATAWRQIH